MREIELKEMQQIELNLLNEFSKVCKKHNLRYYMDGGTLLGAMCYEGFIPWDDDIDLKMPRPDYEKLLKMQSEFPEYIRIDAPSSKHCEYTMLKLIDDRTVLEETNGAASKTTGVYLDVFPMDGHPDDENECEKHIHKLQRLNSLFHEALIGFATMKKSSSILSRIKGAIYDMIYTPWGLYKKLTKTAEKYAYDECQYVGLLIEGDALKERFERSWLDNPVELEFEKGWFPAPSEYKKHLSIFFGSHVVKKEYYHNLPMIPPAHKNKAYWKCESKNEIAVSVAVITYNMEQYLPQLLDSILMQKTNFCYEIVVDDDHSPDNSREILLDYKEKYPDKFVLSLRDENVGGSRNMYGVLRQCRGKYIAILEGDDWWECDDKLQYQYDFMESHSEYIGMYCNSWCELSRFGNDRHVRRDIKNPMVFSYKDFMNAHFFDRLPNSTDTAFFHNIFKDGAEEELDVFYKAHDMVWDQSLALILYGKGDVYVDPRIVSHHRTIVEKDGTNYQSKYARENHSESDAYMYAMHEEYMEKVLHRNCRAFYKVRGKIFAEQFFIAMRNRSSEDIARVKRIWKQRRKKMPLVKACIIWGCGTIRRKIFK